MKRRKKKPKQNTDIAAAVGKDSENETKYKEKVFYWIFIV